MFDYVFDIWVLVEDRHRNWAGLISQFSMLSNGPKLQYHLHDLWPISLRWISCYFLLVPGFWRSYLKLTAVIDTNYGKTTRIPNIPETRTLLKHETDRNENFGNEKKSNLKTAIKSFESHGFFWVGRLMANKQPFNLGPKSHKT